MLLNLFGLGADENFFLFYLTVIILSGEFTADADSTALCRRKSEK
jgi:hypothetical protein